MKRYILIAKQKDTPYAFRDAEDRKEFMGRFGAWTKNLIEKNQFEGADELPKAHKRVEQRNDSFNVVDGPYAETKELLTGYFLVKAGNMEEATQIAKACPVLRFDDLEVYELGDKE